MFCSETFFLTRLSSKSETNPTISETHYIIKKVKVSDVTESYLHDAWSTKDKELELFYNKNQIAQKKIAKPVSSQAWLLQNLGTVQRLLQTAL